MFLGSSSVERPLTETTKKSRLLVCGCTNASITLWDISFDTYQNLGYIGGNDAAVYHETEITTICKPSTKSLQPTQEDDMTLYSGDSSGCVIVWKQQKNDNSILHGRLGCSGQDFVALFQVNKKSSMSVLKASSILHISDNDWKESNDSLLHILAKDGLDSGFKVIVCNRTTGHVSRMFHLTCEESYERVVCATFLSSEDGYQYIMGGSNVGRLYLWDYHRGIRVQVSKSCEYVVSNSTKCTKVCCKSTKLASICVSYPVRSLTWNSTCHVMAWSFAHVDGAVIILRNSTGNR
jgi:WD40 repeat protein